MPHIQRDAPVERLSELPPGRIARIQHIDESVSIRRRMEDLGIHAGSCISCERRSVLGDPCAYRIGQTDTVVALRRCDAMSVHIREEVDPWV